MGLEEKIIFQKGKTYQFQIKTTKKSIEILDKVCKILEKAFDTKIQGNGLHLGELWNRLAAKSRGRVNKDTKSVENIYVVISIDPDSIFEASLYIDNTDEFYNEEDGIIINMMDIFDGKFEFGEQ